jgi:hypothetical protein
MNKEAQTSVRRLHLCKAKTKGDRMWSLTKTKWQVDGETKMASTFQKTYIDDPHYSLWWCCVTGYHGCVPCNNHMQRHSLCIEGAAVRSLTGKNCKQFVYRNCMHYLYAIFEAFCMKTAACHVCTKLRDILCMTI